MKTLVVCYSRTGTTRSVGVELATALGADFDLIISREPRAGVLGYLRSGYEATFARQANITHAARAVDGYDLVVVGTPTWSSSMSSPVRTYLTKYGTRFRSVAFFVTCGGRGGERVVHQMEKMCGHAPLASLVVREAEVKSRTAHDAIQAFAQRIANQSRRLEAA